MNGRNTSASMQYFSENLPEMLSDIRELVACESPSGNVKLLNECADKLSGIIERRTGIKPSSTQLGDESRLLSVSVGREDGGATILVLCHYDTVFPAGTIKRKPLRIEGDRLNGPGVLDMKAGIVQGIWAIKFLIDHNLLGVRTTLLLTPDEETGSMLSRRFIEDAGRNAQLVIVLEPSENGKIKTGRKGVGTYEIAVTGKASHAGLHPEEGINAIAEIAGIILRLNEIQDISRGTTINVGTISGGTATNVVPDHASIGVDVRISNMTEAQRVDDTIRSIRLNNPEARITVSGGINRLPMIKNWKTVVALERVRDIGKSIGLKIEDVSVGGGSDGNILAQFGMAILDGMGAFGSGAHSGSEHVEKSSVPSRTALLAGVLAEFSKASTYVSCNSSRY